MAARGAAYGTQHDFAGAVGTAEHTDRGTLGDLLQDFVNRVSPAQERGLAVLDNASVTPSQVRLLRRVAANGVSTPSELAEQMHVSLPGVTQMLEHLVQLALVSRVESTDDRRKRIIAATAQGESLLHHIFKARSADYAAAIAPLSPPVRSRLAQVLRDALAEM